VISQREYNPDNTILRHQYGVALSRAGRTSDAIEEFTKIIDTEELVAPVRPTLLMAYKTKIINLRRMGQLAEAYADLARARQIIAENPHVQDQARHIEELEMDSAR